MTPEIIVKYIHFVSIFTIIGALVGQHLLLGPILSRATVTRIWTLDRIYGLSSMILLAAGFTLWFGVGKPADYYSHNWVFLLKLGLFVVVGLLSIYPTLFYARNRKGDPDEEVAIPSRVKLFVRLQLTILFILPFLAASMAKGFGSF